MLSLKIRLLFTVAILSAVASIASALAPSYVPYACPGGGQGWIVFEDRNNDGNYDWQTSRNCDGVVTSSRFPPTSSPPIRSHGTLTSGAADYGSFSANTCSGSNIYNWSVSEYNSSNTLLATISQSCIDSVTISYPPRVRPIPNIDQAPSLDESQSQPNIERDHQSNDVTRQLIFPNPATDFTTLRIDDLNHKGDVQVQIIDAQGSLVFFGTSTSSELLSGKGLPTGQLKNGTYYVKILDSNGQVVKSDKLIVTR